ncbi:pimeloyl-ACP methyl ester carboxylesterase [Larkinella arboricola]|uniref:Pimeloyl-ACP methyl ester carboxylesterase n=1 Tax=Larkinella arboricola TaxID=643671 RepID=A0A327WM03_LARAB|nr:alpha/beta hydrolase [Larkinella arboricola]RAJ92295.1 pimeloyl-ACP methyl ester carboxylesterase [Larkinella arboricola]
MRLLSFQILACLGLLFLPSVLVAQSTGVDYPYPVQFLSLNMESKPVRMAYMDVRPAQPNGKTVLLLHGKNFNGYYWQTVIRWLTANGYRAIVPDQVGWGKSSHPDIHYSFHRLAANTRHLLDTLGIQKVTVLAHSMGGMLGTRFTLMYPEIVEKLVLENPIGLEDYKTFVPYQTIEQQFQKEKSATFESYQQYQKSYYPVWKPEYDDLVQVQASDLKSPDFNAIAWSNAVTYLMIYEQPVCYEFNRLKTPTLLIIGQEDRTVVGKNLLSKTEQARHGLYPELGRQTVKQLQSGKLIELDGVGHIPHIQAPERFLKALGDFLK